MGSRFVHQAWQFGSGLGACLLLVWILASDRNLPDRFAGAHTSTVPAANAEAIESASPAEMTTSGAAVSTGDDRFAPLFDLNASINAEPVDSTSGSGTSSNRTGSTAVRSVATLHRPPMDTDSFGAIQHTPTGRARLGRWLFQRLFAADHLDALYNDVHYWLGERAGGAYRPTSLVSESVFIDHPLWPELARWWDEHGTSLAIPWRTDLSRLFGRFDELANKSRTPTEDEELWGLVVTCGRDWLRIPYDEKALRFDLTADLPADAPETALNYYRAMYRILSGREWGTIMTPETVTPEGVQNPSPQEGGPQRFELRLRPRRPSDIP